AGREVALRHAVLISLSPHAPVAPDLDLEPFTERVDHGDTDSVQPAGDFVGRVLELATRMKHGQHDFCCRPATLLVHIDRDAAAVAAAGAGPWERRDDLDATEIAGRAFVHRFAPRLVEGVVQAVGAGVADVHGRPFPDGLQPFEDLDVAGCVGFRAHAAPL